MSTSTLLPPTERTDDDFDLHDERLALLAEAIRENRYQVEGERVADSMLRWLGRI